MYYILNEDDAPEPCDDLTKWSEWFMENLKSNVFDDYLPNCLYVRTAFVGQDDRFWETKVLYEDNGTNGTIVLRADNYRSKHDAIDGHARAVAWARKLTPEEILEYEIN